MSGEYMPYNSLYGGMYYLRKPRQYASQMRFSMYRWHIPDPIRFTKDLKVTIQDLGWYPNGEYKPRRDDIYTVAYWYQTLPTAPFPLLPESIDLEIT